MSIDRTQLVNKLSSMLETANTLQEMEKDINLFHRLHPDIEFNTITQDEIVRNHTDLVAHHKLLKKYIDLYNKKIAVNICVDGKFSVNTTFMRDAIDRIQVIMGTFSEVTDIRQWARASKTLQVSIKEIYAKAEDEINSGVINTSVPSGLIAEKLLKLDAYRKLRSLREVLEGGKQKRGGLQDSFQVHKSSEALLGRVLSATPSAGTQVSGAARRGDERAEAEAKMIIYTQERFATLTYKHVEGGVVYYSSFIEFESSKKHISVASFNEIQDAMKNKIKIMSNLEKEIITISRLATGGDIGKLREKETSIDTVLAPSVQNIIYQTEAVIFILRERIKGLDKYSKKTYRIEKDIDTYVNNTLKPLLSLAEKVLASCVKELNKLEKEIEIITRAQEEAYSEFEQLKHQYLKNKQRYADREKEVWKNLPDYKKEQVKKGSRSGMFLPAGSLRDVVDNIRKETVALLNKAQGFLTSSNINTGQRIALKATKDGLDSLLALIDKENPPYNKQQSIDAETREQGYIEDVNNRLAKIYKAYSSAVTAKAFLIGYTDSFSYGEKLATPENIANTERLHKLYLKCYSDIVELINYNPFDKRHSSDNSFFVYRWTALDTNLPAEYMAPVLKMSLQHALTFLEKQGEYLNKQLGHLHSEIGNFKGSAPAIDLNAHKKPLQPLMDDIEKRYKYLQDSAKKPEIFREGLDDKMYEVAVEANKRFRANLHHDITALLAEADSQITGLNEDEDINSFRRRLVSVDKIIQRAKTILSDIANDKYSIKYSTQKPVYQIKTRKEIEDVFYRPLTKEEKAKIFSEHAPDEAVKMLQKVTDEKPSIINKDKQLRAEVDKLVKGNDTSWVAEMEQSLISMGGRLDDDSAIHKLNMSKRIIVEKRISLLKDMNMLLRDIKMARRYPVNGKITDAYIKYLNKIEAQIYAMKPFYKESYLEMLLPFYEEYKEKHPKKPLKVYKPIPKTIEQAAKMEGWEPVGYYALIHSAGLKYQIQYKFISNTPPVGREIIDEQPMALNYDEHPHGLRPLPGFHGYLLDAIRLEKRTATTQSYIIKGKVGDVIKFWGKTGFTYCEITAEPYDITTLAPPLKTQEEYLAEDKSKSYRFVWGRYPNIEEPSFEVSTQAPNLPDGDKRFSALNAKFAEDGETVEMKYHFDVKGWRQDAIDNGRLKNCMFYQGKPSANGRTHAQLWAGYKYLWVKWAALNPSLMKELHTNAYGRRLTDKFATTTISQARALCEILNGDVSCVANELLMPTLERLPSGGVLGKEITTVLQEIDFKKAMAKADLANKYIGWGEGVLDPETKLNASSTEHYRIQAGLLANTGVYFPTDVVFVSVPGIRGGKNLAYKNIFKTLAEVKLAVQGGATLLTDNKHDVDASWYNIGEQELKTYLTLMGVSYTEIVHKGCLIGVWNKSKIKVVKDKEDIFISTQTYHNRELMAKALKRTHPLLAENGKDNNVDILDRMHHVIAVGYDRVVFGDHGAYVEMNYTQMELGIQWDLYMKGAGAYFDEMYSPGHAKVYKQLRDVKKLKQPPEKTTNIHAWRQNVRKGAEGYADYIPGKFYVSVDDIIVRKHKGKVIPVNLLTLENEIPVLISNIGHFNNITEVINAQLSRFESVLFRNVSSEEVVEIKKEKRKKKDSKKSLSNKEKYSPDYDTAGKRRNVPIPEGATQFFSDGDIIAIQKAYDIVNEIKPKMDETTVRVKEILSLPASKAQNNRIERLTPPYNRLNKDRDIIQIAIIRFSKMLGVAIPGSVSVEPDLIIRINNTPITVIKRLIKEASEAINIKAKELQERFSTTRKDTTVLADELLEMITNRDGLLISYNKSNMLRIRESVREVNNSISADAKATPRTQGYLRELDGLLVDSKGGNTNG